MILNIEIIEFKKFVLVKYRFSMSKTIIFECGVINVCSSSITCEIIFWMVKGVIVTRRILTQRFWMLNIFISLEGHIPPQHDIPYVKWDINKEPADENFLYGAKNYTDKEISDIEISSYEFKHF